MDIQLAYGVFSQSSEIATDKIPTWIVWILEFRTNYIVHVYELCRYQIDICIKLCEAPS